MFAVIETFIDHESGERGEDCITHQPSEKQATRAKELLEEVAPDCATYEVKNIGEPATCPECERELKKKEVDPARPEPMPVTRPGGFEVVPLIIREINTMPFWHDELIDKGTKLIKWLQKRSDFGFEKYHARLTFPNGRDFHKDLCDELADAVNYARGAVEAGQIDSLTYNNIVIMADRVINLKEKA